MFMSYYKWVWRIRDAINGGLLAPAALLASVTDRRFSFEDLYDAVANQ